MATFSMITCHETKLKLSQIGSITITVSSTYFTGVKGLDTSSKYNNAFVKTNKNKTTVAAM